MINTNTINGISIYTIRDMFIAKINEPLVQPMDYDLFTVHDCIHFFTDLGVSIPEEKIIAEIQHYMLDKRMCSPKAQIYIIRLLRAGVYEELRTALTEAREELFASVN